MNTASVPCCSICLEPFIDPVTLACGHSFCRHELEQTTTPHCPSCRKPFDKSTLSAVNGSVDLRTAVEHLVMKCPKCGEEMKRAAYIEHKRAKHAPPPVSSIRREPRGPALTAQARYNQIRRDILFGENMFGSAAHRNANTRNAPPDLAQILQTSLADVRAIVADARQSMTEATRNHEIQHILDDFVRINSTIQVPSRDVEVVHVRPAAAPFSAMTQRVRIQPFNVNFNQVRYTTFDNTAATLKRDIEQHGVAVIRNVLTADQCAHAIELSMSFLGNVFTDPNNNVSLTRTVSWRNITKCMFALHGGLIQHFHAGQSDVAWYVRTIPAVRAIFDQFWGTSNLFCSFDGINITPPPEATNCGWQSPKNHWLHTDQSEKKRGLRSIQGLVNLVDVDEGDATLMVFKGSNVLHEAFFAHFKEHAKDDWFRIDDSHAAWFIAHGCEPIAISARAGDMIFWDSRTIHMGLGPSRGRANPSRWRHVVYVAMFDAATLSKVEVLKRKMFIEEGRTSNHWGTTAFPKNPHAYGGPLPEQRPWQHPLLSAEAKRLIAGDRTE